MSNIPESGNPHDFYCCPEGNKEFARFPGGLVPSIDTDIPIFLQRGNPSWGAIHIATKHGHWVSKTKKSIHELVWSKLQAGGAVYSTENEMKVKISLRLSPSALLVLKYIPNGDFLTVVTLYAHPNALDGKSLGRYRGSTGNQKMPLFSLPGPVMLEAQLVEPIVAVPVLLQSTN